MGDASVVCDCHRRRASCATHATLVNQPRRIFARVLRQDAHPWRNALCRFCRSEPPTDLLSPRDPSGDLPKHWLAIATGARHVRVEPFMPMPSVVRFLA